MKLILDFGNTFQKCALVEEGSISVTSFENITLSDLRKFVEGKEIDSVILSSVINFDNRIRAWLADNFFFVELTENTPIPVANKYKTPETLGKDRLAAAIGAWSLFKGRNVLSVDCGTAIKYDLVTAGGEYLGGGISPGLWLRFKALHTFTDKLPLVSYEFQPALIGDDTESSMKSGVINGALAEIDGIINRYKDRFNDLKAVMTGGEMIYFEKSIKSNIFAEPNLVIRGLHQILLFNEKQKIY
jgi:type III pantothenate kinase